MGISPQIIKEAAAATPPLRESPDLLSIGIEQGEFEQANPQRNGNSLPLILTIHSFCDRKTYPVPTNLIQGEQAIPETEKAIANLKIR